MKKGIHLGPPLASRALASTLALVALGALGVVLGVVDSRAYREVAALELELQVGGVETGPSPGPLAPARDRETADRLRSILQSGLLGATPPTQALRAVAESLPEGVILASLSLKASPPNRSLLLEAVADDAEKVTELQRRMARSPMVTATRLLEERRSVEGKLVVRLQVDLAESSP